MACCDSITNDLIDLYVIFSELVNMNMLHSSIDIHHITVI